MISRFGSPPVSVRLGSPPVRVRLGELPEWIKTPDRELIAPDGTKTLIEGQWNLPVLIGGGLALALIVTKLTRRRR